MLIELGSGDRTVLQLLPPRAESGRIRGHILTQVQSTHDDRGRQEARGRMCHLFQAFQVRCQSAHFLVFTCNQSASWKTIILSSIHQIVSPVIELSLAKPFINLIIKSHHSHLTATIQSVLFIMFHNQNPRETWGSFTI